ncbi:unnamed protein product [Thlaspi arvense]|uniref:Ubiquitin-like domain-containing protein n=1 Tax=Thlaspi arvense TaxID=13288 RepID=A0AAU9SN37_THLAR|nr:unnamed protein product [Thlaspi arvense]
MCLRTIQPSQEKVKMPASDEKRPSVPSNRITVKVSNQKEKCVIFRIKRDVKLRRMMEAFSDKLGIKMSTLRCHFDGKRIKPNQTLLQ